MNRHLLLSALLASAALADVPPRNSAGCHGQAAGAACTTDDGQPGLCTTSSVSRLDYSTGIPPKSKQVEMLLCVATAASHARAVLPGWAFGAGFAALLGLLAASSLRRRRQGPPGVAALLRLRRGGPAH